MRQASKRIPESAENTVRDIRRDTRQHHAVEEKIRIVLEGLRGEDSTRRAIGEPTNDIIDRAIDDLKDAVKLDPTSKTNANALADAYLVKWNERDAQVHIQVQVIEDLRLRDQPDPYARNILAKMPKGSQVAVTDTCRTWMGSGRGAKDADNIWCPVLYAGHRGWANAYYLADHGGRVACVIYPPAGGCASTAGR